MSTHRFALSAVFALGAATSLLSACGDSTRSKAQSVADEGVRPVADATEIDSQPPSPPSDIPPDAAPGPDDDAGPAPDSDAALGLLDATKAVPDGPPPAPQPLWVEVSLTPREPLYSLEDTPAASARVFDRSGAEMPDTPVMWRVDPPGVAMVDAEGHLTFTGEGAGTVLGCATDVICGRAAFYVDAGPPKLTVIEPDRGAALGGDRSETIAVRGNAIDSGGHVDVRVNGLSVEVGPDGSFALDVPATFGINHIEVTADDGVRQPAVRVTRDVLWAPRYVPVQPSTARVDDAARLWLGQSVLDLDAPVVIPEGAGPLDVDDLASLLTAVLAAADPNTLLAGAGGLLGGDGAGIALVGASLGEPEVDLYVVPEGLEVFLRLGGLRVDVGGQFAFEGQSLSLDGHLDASLAAFASLGLDVAGDGTLTFAVTDSGVVLESLTGQFQDAAAQALIATIGSRLRGTLESVATGVVDGLIRAQLPAVIGTGLDGLIGSLAHLPIHLDTNIPGAPVVDLDLALSPQDALRRRRTGLALSLGATLTHPAPVQAPAAVPGIPALSEGDPPQGTDVPLSLALRLELINGLLHEVWRTGLLQLQPALPAELAGLLQSVRIDARLPPVIAPAALGGEFPLEAQLGEVHVFVVGPGGGDPDELDVTLRAGISLRMDENGSLRLVSADMPDVHTEILLTAGPHPVLGPDLLNALFGGVIWPRVRDALAGGLALSIPAVQVDAASFSQLAPRLQGLALKPTFDQPPVLFGGWMLLEGRLQSELQLGP